MSLEVKAGKDWRHMQTPTFDGVEAITFQSADGLKIPSLNGRRKGLFSQRIDVLIDHQVSENTSFTEIIFICSPGGLALPAEFILRSASWNNLQITPPDRFDHLYPPNSLIVRLNPGEWVGFGEMRSPVGLRIIDTTGQKVK